MKIPRFQKTGLVVTKPVQRQRRIATWHWILSAIGLLVLLLSAGLWAKAQSANPQNPQQPLPQPGQGAEPPMTPERELARQAILNPAAFEKLARKVKTPQELQDEEIAKFAISQPKAYSAEFEKFKTPERKQLEQKARAAVLDPVTHSGPLSKKAKNPQSPVNAKP